MVETFITGLHCGKRVKDLPKFSAEEELFGQKNDCSFYCHLPLLHRLKGKGRKGAFTGTGYIGFQPQLEQES